MKYLDTRGFKAEEASRSCQQADPLQPSHGHVSAPQPAPHVGHKPTAPSFTVQTPPGEKKREFTEEIAPVSKHTHREEFFPSVALMV